MDCVKVDIKNQRTIFTREKIPKRNKDTDVIVKVAFAGFCGTDLHIILVNMILILFLRLKIFIHFLKRFRVNLTLKMTTSLDMRLLGLLRIFRPIILI